MDASLNIPINLLEGGNSNPLVEVFDAKSFVDDIESGAYEQFYEAVANIKAIRRHYITVCATSFGKDSTVVLLAALRAHIELMEEGVLDGSSPFVVSHIDTLVENHLVQMLSLYERDRLKEFCQQKGINLDLRVGKPPLAKQWAALFLSGLKIISSARTNNDCSEIMKVENAARIERSIENDYTGQVVTLLGSRLSESVRRGANMRKRGTDKVSVDSLLDNTDSGERVFAPIMDMTDDDIWTIIRQAGTLPIQISLSGNDNIPSYARNHRLLHMIYSDSKEGSCPVSAKRIKGETAKVGGCGGSARTGCYLCAKSTTDKSGEAQAKMVRHSQISGNILKVRNYIMYVAQDIRYRTYHSRAVDLTTGTIALQPNVLNAQTIDKLIWLLSQATWDDDIRAEEFRNLVAQGREMEDPGYADIINDSTLDDRDRAEMAKVYKDYAVNPLISPMSLELAIYLSAIHSRDGIRLPPNRALYIWDQTSKDVRIPYPEVDPKNAIVDDIPDAIMVIPTPGVERPSILSQALLDEEASTGCDTYSKQHSLTMPVSHARYFLQGDDAKHIEGLRNSDKVQIQGLTSEHWSRIYRDEPLNKPVKHRFSKRAIKKVSRKGGQYKVTERGRTSLDSPSFSQREAKPSLEERLTTSLPIYKQATSWDKDLLLADNPDAIVGYDIDYAAMHDWNQFGGAEEALRQHDDFVALHEKHDESVYFYGGIGAFESFLRYGVLKLNKSAKSNTLRILSRTAYFHSIGLFDIDESAVVAISERRGLLEDTKLSSYRNNFKANRHLNIEAIYPMDEYRTYKAGILLKLRSERNLIRKSLKKSSEGFKSKPVAEVKAMLNSMWNDAIDSYEAAVKKILIANTLIQSQIYAFDGEDYRQSLKLNLGVMRYIEVHFSDMNVLLGIVPRNTKRHIEDNTLAKHEIVLYSSKLSQSLRGIKEQVKAHTIEQVEKRLLLSKDSAVLMHNGIDELIWPIELDTSYAVDSFNDTFNLNSDISGVTDISW
ncbi:phosphoadenosine phosphosulfate reductase domain-containing protein [Alteromonas gilva]|uniref:Phosphoadenosine phosphosulfate reductase family protein n=1 Tax=Alteromonas gilva TaxID=2987522 RepID=A0ABT5L8Y2_9ALTE|nr:phosphoadenosine phosphosulfate reductase family protein [Alteromonas gilva]MDC8832986.1 phosphoadenosine phosphosulfate reductase family protein [Alteromonas gilva]